VSLGDPPVVTPVEEAPLKLGVMLISMAAVATSMWRLSWAERLVVLFTGRVYLQQLVSPIKQ
jgi:hypothetical protein